MACKTEIFSGVQEGFWQAGSLTEPYRWRKTGSMRSISLPSARIDETTPSPQLNFIKLRGLHAANEYSGIRRPVAVLRHAGPVRPANRRIRRMIREQEHNWCASRRSSPPARPERALHRRGCGRVQSNLGFRVPGKVVERLVDTGQTVHAGQPLMRIDRTDLALPSRPRPAMSPPRRRALAGRRRRGALPRRWSRAGAVSKSATIRSRRRPTAPRRSWRRREAQGGVARERGRLCRAARRRRRHRHGNPGRARPGGRGRPDRGPAGACRAARGRRSNLPEAVRPALGSVGRGQALRRPTAASPARLRQLSEPPIRATRTFEARYVLERRRRRAPLGATVTIAHRPRGARRGARGSAGRAR